ncbi:MAG: hypothetical protein PQ612_10715 [Rickettsiales bacterium]|nr:hypothetical protein [Rickettsiales bacterium]MDG4548769.1 hypothetical protein [Rickettsiales bacterium]
MFEHEKFDVYDYAEIPLNRDCYLMDEKYIDEYEKSFLDFFDGAEYEHVGYISYIAVRSINEHSLELSWYANIHDRFHEVIVTLPKDQLIVCVGCWQCDEKPHLFVKSGWLEHLHLRRYSVFAMFDVIGVKEAIKSGALSKEKLIALREATDALATANPDLSFISFADSLLLKSNWTVGHFQSEVTYTYSPERFIYLFKELQSIYREQLGLAIYGIFTQGSNEYYDDEMLHISESQNHICLNSLGAPFADLLSIDETARQCIRSGAHTPQEIYMDEHFYYSLRFKFGFEKHKGANQPYNAKMRTESGHYFYGECRDIIENLREEEVIEHNTQAV